MNPNLLRTSFFFANLQLIILFLLNLTRLVFRLRISIRRINCWDAIVWVTYILFTTPLVVQTPPRLTLSPPPQLPLGTIVLDIRDFLFLILWVVLFSLIVIIKVQVTFAINVNLASILNSFFSHLWLILTLLLTSFIVTYGHLQSEAPWAINTIFFS